MLFSLCSYNFLWLLSQSVFLSQSVAETSPSANMLLSSRDIRVDLFCFVRYRALKIMLHIFVVVMKHFECFACFSLDFCPAGYLLQLPFLLSFLHSSISFLTFLYCRQFELFLGIPLAICCVSARLVTQFRALTYTALSKSKSKKQQQKAGAENIISSSLSCWQQAEHAWH